MLNRLLITIIFLISFMANSSELYKFNFEYIDGKSLSLKSFKNMPILFVNTASMCGFTKQYEGLQTLYDTYKDKGLVVIGMPSNSFLQEYDDENQVKDFCETKFDISFPMTKIINVTGEEKHPFYKWLKENYGVKPKWNFYKFLFNKEGEFVNSFSSMTKPTSEKIIRLIEKEINS